MFSRSMYSHMIKTIATTIVFFVCSSHLFAQRNMSAADTGRLVWGHAEFMRYDRASMCNRTIDEVDRQYTRIFIKDTVLESIRGSKEYSPKIHNSAIETVKRCIAHLQLNEQTNDQLWAVARIYMVIGEKQKSKEVVERVIATGINRSEKIELKLQAIEMYLNYSADYLPHVYYFVNLIRSEEPVSHVARFKVDFLMSNFYFILYNPDSVLHYTNSAIESLEKMNLEEMDSIPAFDPFSLQINIANINGDIPMQERILDRAKELVSNWKSGLGERFITATSSGIDRKKTVYSKKTNSFESAIWENYDGVPRPLIGKPSLFVVISHNCGGGCASRFSAIKRLKRTFGDSLDIVLITQTMGYAPGTGPLTPSEEGKIAAKFLKEIHDLPFTLLVDESPTHKMPDGRIIRDRAPVTQMLEEVNSANALITDADGRIQWAGNLQNEWHMRSITAVIDRALSKMKK